jgi:phospholipid-binding lipoprotein MlaA
MGITCLALLLLGLWTTLPARADESNGDEASEEDPLLAELDIELEHSEGFPDPWEPFNRQMLAVNEGLDRWLLSPLVRAYTFVLPGPARLCVRRFFFNLRSPAILANDLLQLEFLDAGVTLGRFVTNSTIGVAGVFDPATQVGLEAHDSDFGQTLALAGVPSGPFLIVPLLGPMCIRDGFGTITDMFFRPTTYVLGPFDQLFYYSIHGGGAGIVAREKDDRALEALHASSVDYYAALRNAYYQYRMGFIWRRTGSESAGSIDGLASR